jgi:hypothetical protein
MPRLSRHSWLQLQASPLPPALAASPIALRQTAHPALLRDRRCGGSGTVVGDGRWWTAAALRDGCIDRAHQVTAILRLGPDARRPRISIALRPGGAYMRRPVFVNTFFLDLSTIGRRRPTGGATRSPR